MFNFEESTESLHTSTPSQFITPNWFYSTSNLLQQSTEYTNRVHEGDSSKTD